MSVASVTIGDIAADLRSGFASGEEDPHGVVQFRMNNVGRTGEINWDKLRRVPSSRMRDELAVQPGDILFNATNSPELVGKTALFSGFPEPVTFSNHFIRIRTKRSAAEPAYVARWLQREFERGRFAGMCRSWVNQASITKDQLISLSFPLPSLDQQRRIAAILDKADGLRQKRKLTLDLLDGLTQSTFLEMFGDPVSNPKNFPLVSFGQIGTLDRGVSKHRPRNDPVLLGGSHPLIQTGDVANSGGYIRRYSSTYSEEGLRQSREWPAGTLCITIAANIAQTGILTFPACFPDSVVGFQHEQPAMVQFVRVWLMFLRATLERTAPTVAQKNINLQILRDLKIALPPFDMVSLFADRLGGQLTTEKHMQFGYLQAKDLFSSLQSRAFSGELG